ncbi:MAG: FtsX-like permease family protein [Elusimicrobiota bacterium]
MIRFLLKGLIRDRSRSFFPVLMVAAGVFITVFLHGWIKGAFDGIIGANAQFDTGHVKIITVAYRELADQMPNDLALLSVKKILEERKNSRNDITWTPRIRFGGLIDIPDEKGETRSQGPVFGFGIDLRGKETPEIEILNLHKALAEGKLPQKENEILISKEFAEKLDIKTGQTATLISSTMNGSMAMHNFIVSGMVHFGMSVMDKGAIIADIRDIQIALDMPDGASEILGFKKDMIYRNAEMMSLAEEYNSSISDGDPFSPVMLTLGQQNGLGEYVNLGMVFAKIITLIFLSAMSIVLWNAGLMNGLRRYGEIGVRLAMGEPKGSIYRRMILESVAIGFAGSVLGTIFGSAIVYYLQVKGFDFSSMMQKSSMLIYNVIRTRVTPATFYIGFLPGVFASVIGTMFAGIGIYRRQTSQLFKELEV